MSEKDQNNFDQSTLDTQHAGSRYETITIPAASVDLPESDQTEVNDSEKQPSFGGHGKYAEHVHGHSFSSLAGRQLIEDSVSDTRDLESLIPENMPKTESVNTVQSIAPHLDVSSTILDRIKAVKESLKTSTIESFATVKFVFIPVGQEIIMPFKLDTAIKSIKDHFSSLLNIPPYVLQINCRGMILKDNESLLQLGVKPEDVVQMEIFSTDPDFFPIKTIYQLNERPYYITVKVQTDISHYQEVPVEITKSDFHKPFLGGFRHKITGKEYHHAGTQTLPKKLIAKQNVFSRDTQTVFERKKLQQTTNTTSTQMTKIGVYVSNVTDKLITPGKYLSAEEYHAQRLKAVIVLQTYYRQWHARLLVEDLKRQKRERLKWEEEEEEKKLREKEKMMQLDYYRRHNPQSQEDFELLYNALEFWHQEEVSRINECLTGAEKKASLCEVLEKETQIIASIGRHRDIAYEWRKEEKIHTFLDKCSAPTSWRTSNGKMIEMDTQFTIRASELKSIYKCILLKNISQDERLDVLLTLKHTVKEHECKLTQEILELIDREVDLMMRGVRNQNLEGLRKRIATLFLQYIKTPLFNPEVARYLKVPQDPLKFYKNIYFCHSCQLYLPSTEFAVSSTSQRLFRCRNCTNLDNETRQRESFLKYKSLLKRLYVSEANYDDDSRIAFLMQLQDIQYLTENIWSSQSVLSAWKDINDLVMVRWNKNLEWSPWNCILLTREEAQAHLKLENVEKEYHPSFIHKIRHKHILAKNYFSQIPVLASFLLGDSEVEKIRRKYYTEIPKIIEILEPGPEEE